ncbi:MAG: hypothetical protein Tsb0021_08370 [Chlamydiales bacterium]
MPVSFCSGHSIYRENNVLIFSADKVKIGFKSHEEFWEVLEKSQNYYQEYKREKWTASELVVINELLERSVGKISALSFLGFLAKYYDEIRAESVNIDMSTLLDEWVCSYNKFENHTFISLNQFENHLKQATINCLVREIRLNFFQSQLLRDILHKKNWSLVSVEENGKETFIFERQAV